MKYTIIFLVVISAYQVIAESGSELSEYEKSLHLCLVRHFEHIQEARPKFATFFQLYEYIGLMCTENRYLTIDYIAKYEMARCLQNKFEGMMDLFKKVKDENSTLLEKEAELDREMKTFCVDEFSDEVQKELSKEAEEQQTEFMTQCQDCLIEEYDEVMKSKDSAINNPNYVWLAELIPVCMKYFDMVVIQKSAQFTACIFENTDKFAAATKLIREESENNEEVIGKLFLKTIQSICEEPQKPEESETNESKSGEKTEL